MRILALLAPVSALLFGSVAAQGAEGRLLVVLLESDARHRLRDALRIQLPREVVLETEPLAPAPSIANQIRQGREQLARRGGLLALFIAEDAVVGDEREITVYFVARRGDRALVEVVRVRAGAGEELERAVALKALEVLEALRAAPQADLIVPFAGTGAERQPTSVPPGRARRDGVSLVAELGAALASPAGSAPAQFAGQAALGVSLSGPAWQLEAVGSARAPAPFERNEPAGALRATELDALVSMRASWRTETFAFGGHASAGARFMSVEGSTAAGSRGRSDRTVPVLALGPEARVGVFAPWLWVRCAAGPELALRRQVFTLNREPVIDLGRARGVFEVTLMAVVP